MAYHRRMPRNRGSKSELYIWSLVALGMASCIVMVSLLPSDSFGFVSSMIAIGAMGVGMSGKWKNAGDVFHWSVLFTSIVLALAVVIFHSIYPKKINYE